MRREVRVFYEYSLAKLGGLISKASGDLRDEKKKGYDSRGAWQRFRT